MWLNTNQGQLQANFSAQPLVFFSIPIVLPPLQRKINQNNTDNESNEIARNK